jgi:glycosyltransferase involved in cell wall biosynthesis
MPSLKIAMVGPFGFHPNKTMRSRALPLARALVARGHTVHILMPPWQTPAEADRSWEEAGVAIRYVSLRGGMAATAVRLVRETLARQPQVVHTFKPKAYSGLAAWWLWHFRRHKLHLVTDSDDWEGWGGWNEVAPYPLWQKHFFAWQEKWGLRHCHALTVASRSLQSLAWAHGARPKQVIYLPNGPGITTGTGGAIEKRHALGLAGRPVLLLYSRLFEFDTGRLVAILSRVKTAVPDLAILAVGAALYQSDTQQLRQQLETAGLMESVVDTGWLPEVEVPATLAAADLALYLMDDTLLNRTKCPVKLADMAAVGLPVVAEAVGQVPEYLVHGETGLLRPPGDVTGLADDLCRLLQNRDERARLALAARERMRQHFSWENLAAQAERAYQPGPLQ